MLDGRGTGVSTALTRTGLFPGPRLWWAAVTGGGPEQPAAADPDREFTSQARRDQGETARRTLRAALTELGLTTGEGDPQRILPDPPSAVRRVRVDGRRLRPDLQFSLAHTARHAVVAIRRTDGPATGLGVDAEDDWDGAGRNLHRFGTRAELDLIAADHPGAHPLHLWCAKEALAKATGHGFAVPPRRHRLLAGDGAPHTLLLEIAENHRTAAPRPARVRVGTRRTWPPTAWAVAELPLTGTANEGSEHRSP
ncbi:4'-phosphopantetheinyl transferase family protein [Streptomyces sp. NPDC057426]|uniref:4'-phosphopantetheinyl transferase family protein n=1 Tax=Streptomyces sp. NPDC057426 TaxID=3346128 RepID=UPI00369AB6BD